MADASDHERAPARRRRAVTGKTVGAVAVAALLIAFGVANRGDVEIDWLLFTSENSLIIVILVSAVLGAVLGALAARRRSR